MTPFARNRAVKWMLNFPHALPLDDYSERLLVRRQWEGAVIPGRGKKSYWLDNLLPFQNSKTVEGEYERKHHPWRERNQPK